MTKYAVDQTDFDYDENYNKIKTTTRLGIKCTEDEAKKLLIEASEAAFKEYIFGYCPEYTRLSGDTFAAITDDDEDVSEWNVVPVNEN